MAVICDPLLDPSNIALPRCMRTTPLKETNLSSEFSTFKPSKFGRFTEADAERLVRRVNPDGTVCHYEGEAGAERTVRQVDPNGTISNFEGERGAE